MNQEFKTYLKDKYGLTDGQCEIVNHACRGLNRFELAASIFRSESAVKFQLTAIFKKVGVTTKLELVAKFAPIKFQFDHFGKLIVIRNESVNLPFGEKNFKTGVA